MKRFFDYISSLFSKKTHKRDHAKDAEFKKDTTKDHKVKENKITRGDRFGKRWFPFNRH